MIFYNLFLYFVWNDKNYLYYMSFIISFILWQLCVDGLGHQYLWPETKWLSEKGVLLFISMTIFSALLFTRSFLHLSKYAIKLNYTLIILQIFMFALALSSFILPYSTVIQILVWLIFPIPVILLYAGGIALKNKYQYARFYIIGWSLFLGSSILLALNTLGYIEGYYSIKYVQQIGTLLEVLFFSLALAERINLLRQQNISTLSRLNSRLQSEVHDKILEIRVKDELLIQKFRLATMGEMLENIAHQWKQPLHKLSLVIQNYYFKNKLEGTSEQELEDFNDRSNALVTYMSNTIDDFRNFFNPQKEKEYFDLEQTIRKVMFITSGAMSDEEIQIDILVESKLDIYGYENEFSQVLLNLFSNAKDALIMNNIEDRKIKIKLYETKDEMIITFTDNAGGIDKDILPKIFDPYFSTKEYKDGSGIGLYMSKMIIENSMQGSLCVVNTRTGAEFSIILSKVI
ncbi:GHKL domain-containing protein [Sulfurimonas sp. MAG313]|nr:GHKL domain-containing protein [Sulfurimonas sp. MAG313]